MRAGNVLVCRQPYANLQIMLFLKLKINKKLDNKKIYEFKFNQQTYNDMTRNTYRKWNLKILIGILLYSRFAYTVAKSRIISHLSKSQKNQGQLSHWFLRVMD